MDSLFDTTPAEPARETREVRAEEFARCASCDALKARAQMHKRPDGLHLCQKCKGAQAAAGQTGLFCDNSVTGSLF